MMEWLRKHPRLGLWRTPRTTQRTNPQGKLVPLKPSVELSQQLFQLPLTARMLENGPLEASVQGFRSGIQKLLTCFFETQELREWIHCCMNASPFSVCLLMAKSLRKMAPVSQPPSTPHASFHAQLGNWNQNWKSQTQSFSVGHAPSSSLFFSHSKYNSFQYEQMSVLGAGDVSSDQTLSLLSENPRGDF